MSLNINQLTDNWTYETSGLDPSSALNVVTGTNSGGLAGITSGTLVGSSGISHTVTGTARVNVAYKKHCNVCGYDSDPQNDYCYLCNSNYEDIN